MTDDEKQDDVDAEVEADGEAEDVVPRWVVSAEPLGANPALKPEAAKRVGRERLTPTGVGEEGQDNVGGIVVYIEQTDGDIKEEVARVGFVRSNSENPDVPFDKKLDEVIEIARQSVERLNDLDPGGALV